MRGAAWLASTSIRPCSAAKPGATSTTSAAGSSRAALHRAKASRSNAGSPPAQRLERSFHRVVQIIRRVSQLPHPAQTGTLGHRDARKVAVIGDRLQCRSPSRRQHQHQRAQIAHQGHAIRRQRLCPPPSGRNAPRPPAPQAPPCAGRCAPVRGSRSDPPSGPKRAPFHSNRCNSCNNSPHRTRGRERNAAFLARGAKCPHLDEKATRGVRFHGTAEKHPACR